MENYNNRIRTMRLASYELKSQNNGTYLGFLWNFINPALQIFVYWFVFAIGLNAAAPRGDYPYIIWMIVGIIPWFYISTAMLSSSNSIYAYSGVLKRMYIPLSIVPVKAVITALFSHLLSMVVVFLVIFISGYSVSIYTFQLPYYILCSIAFLIGFSLFASSVTVVFRDFQKILNSVVRLLFYITPVVWSQENLPEHLRFILKLNPLAYIIDGYRDCILYGRGLEWHWKQGIYFWIVTVVLFVIGCNVHMKFREKFIDLI